MTLIKDRGETADIPGAVYVGARVRWENDRAIYLVEWGPLEPAGGRGLIKRHIPNPDTYNSLFPDENGILIGPRPDTLVRGPDVSDGACLVQADDGSPMTYLLDQRGKRAVSDAAFTTFYFSRKLVRKIPAMLLKHIPEGVALGI